MTEYYHIVPWYNSEEWHKAYDKIYSPTSSFLNKQEAHNLLLIWKARCPSLPSGIESTLTILEVHIQDVKNSDDIVNEHLLRLAYSSAIMRFVNHMLDTETAKGSSLYRAALNLGVPDWIIDMRHDTAHSNNLPSIELLREASLISLEWLRSNYWDKHKQCIMDYTSGQKETNNNDEIRITAFINFCISLSICAHNKCNIKNLSEIPNASMRESIVNDARDLFGENIDLTNLKTVSVLGLINIMNMNAKKILKTKDSTLQVSKALVGEDSLFLSLELVKLMGDRDFHNKHKLSKQYIQCFQVLLTFLHTNDLLLNFILELIKVTQCSDSESQRCRLAALWVSEILVALGKSKQFIDKIKKINSVDISSKKNKDLMLLYHHWFPGEKANGLVLDLHKPVPVELKNMHFIQPIISSYNPYLTYFIKDLLNLVEPQLPKDTTEKICTLAKLISSPEDLSSKASKIYTVDDLKMDQELIPSSVDQEEDDDLECVEMSSRSDEESHDQPRSGIWRLASSENDWSNCPLGQLPWQRRQDNIIETENKVA